jgi:cytochrome c5
MSDDHATPIKTPRQLIAVVVLAFVVPITLFLLLSQLFTGLVRPGTSDEDTQLLSRIKPFGYVVLAEAGAAKGSQTGEQVFQSVCKTCHEAGIAGAPKVGDKSAWAPSIRKGYETLVQHAINGFQEPGKVMPPRGGSPDLADVEVQRAVVFMANKSGASFKEPPAPASVATASATAAPRATPSAAAPAAPPAAAVAAATTPTPKASGPLDMTSGLAMMQKDGCIACHSVDKKILGPAYQDVAAKYKGDAGAPAKLVQKVKMGGAGVWGQIPMPPNSQVSDDDIKALVTWILTLKK